MIKKWRRLYIFAAATESIVAGCCSHGGFNWLHRRSGCVTLTCMLYGNRDQVRQVFVDTFRKASADEALSPMEQIIAQVIREHPEYHALLKKGEIVGDYTVEQGETNPFLHMGMHITIREQISIDRPPGIASAWQRLASQEDPHSAEHRMLDCLAETLLQAQRDGTPPDEHAYLQAVRRLAGM